MVTATVRRARPGRAGSAHSARKAMWEALFAARTVLETATDPRVILDACGILVAGVPAYARLWNNGKQE